MLKVRRWVQWEWRREPTYPSQDIGGFLQLRLVEPSCQYQMRMIRVVKMRKGKRNSEDEGEIVILMLVLSLVTMLMAMLRERVLNLALERLASCCQILASNKHKQMDFFLSLILTSLIDLVSLWHPHFLHVRII